MFTYFGSPTQHEKISCDLAKYKKCITIKKEVLYKCEDPERSRSKEERELLDKENELILRYQANNPDIGYNLKPKFKK